VNYIIRDLRYAFLKSLFDRRIVCLDYADNQGPIL
jgi:hypothetical protein